MGGGGNISQARCTWQASDTTHVAGVKTARQWCRHAPLAMPGGPSCPPELAQPDLVPVALAAQRGQHALAPELGVGVSPLLHLLGEGVLGGGERHCRGETQSGGLTGQRNVTLPLRPLAAAAASAGVRPGAERAGRETQEGSAVFEARLTARQAARPLPAPAACGSPGFGPQPRPLARTAIPLPTPPRLPPATPPEEDPISISCRPTTASCAPKAASCTQRKKGEPGSGLDSPTFQVTHSMRRLSRRYVPRASSSQEMLRVVVGVGNPRSLSPCTQAQAHACQLGRARRRRGTG